MEWSPAIVSSPGERRKNLDGRRNDSCRVMANSIAIEEAWRICGDLFSGAIETSILWTPQDVDRELLFCLLGGFGITYELNRSAAEAIARLDPFADRWNDNDLLEAIVTTLSLSQFEPRRRDGSHRQYRFPRRKASIIVNARRWLKMHTPLHEYVEMFSSSKECRRFLCRCPGIGPKTASWLMRNLGWSEHVAIVDTHLLHALASTGRIPEMIRMPRDYDLAEAAFLDWCRELDAAPGAFDLFVWEWQRGTLSTR